MQRKLLYTSIIALIAAGVGYSQLSGVLGWDDDGSESTEAGTLGGKRTGENFNIGMPPARETVNGSRTQKPDQNITLDNGLKHGATVELDGN